MEVANIAAFLPEMARRCPFAPAVIVPHGRDRRGRVAYTHLTYRQLDQVSDHVARGLLLAGIARGTRTALLVRPSLELFSLVFALFKAGIVPVMVDPGIGAANFKRCLAESRPEAFIGIPQAHAARVLLRWSPDTIRHLVTVGRRWFWGGLTLDRVEAMGREAEGPWRMAETSADEVAAILFTSGSTGPPKGVIYRHGNFTAQVHAIGRMMGIRPGEVDLPTFPLFALFDPALGMTTVVPDMDPARPARADPVKLIEAIENFGVTNMFGSPALLETLSRHGAAHGVRLPTVERVISAGAPVSAAVVDRVLGMLEPGSRVVTPYGATEALPVASITSEEILGDTRALTEAGWGVCVGRPVPEAVVRIIRISDEPIPTWDDALVLPRREVGEITVRGPMVTTGYFERDQETDGAKIDEDGQVVHRMGDLGYFDDRGRLWFCGRKAHRVVTSAGTLYTVPCEGVFNAHQAVFRTALVGVDLGSGVEPVLCVELEPEARQVDQQALLGELGQLARSRFHTAGIRRFLVHPGFPVDIRHNAKIDRPQLAVWAQEKLA